MRYAKYKAGHWRDFMMKHLMLMSALFAFTSTAFAEDEVPAGALAQALVDRSESVTKVKHECSNNVRGVKSEKVSDGVYKHTLILARHFRGQPGKDCQVEITQDYRPTYHDAGIAYDFLITELQHEN
jgi:hypothetical protein